MTFGLGTVPKGGDGKWVGISLMLPVATGNSFLSQSKWMHMLMTFIVYAFPFLFKKIIWLPVVAHTDGHNSHPSFHPGPLPVALQCLPTVSGLIYPKRGLWAQPHDLP